MGEHKFLTGKLVYLRALEEKDLQGNYFQWLNDEEVCRFNSHATFPNTEAKVRAYFNSTQQSTDRVVLAIISQKEKEHIGNIALQAINWVWRSAEYAIIIGEKKYWKGGYGTEASRLICEYAFKRLNLHRIHCGTSAENIAMQKLAKKMKMKQEGVRREAFFKNGQYHDMIEYGVLANEFLK